MRLLLLTLAQIFFVALCAAQNATPVKNKPNIILIVADDLGYGDLGVYGQTKIRTPNLDRMAKQGIRFTNFYAGTTVCAPSRSALMTGLHTGHTPIRGNKSVGEEGQWPLPDSALTIAELLKNGGYTTGDFGKWGLGPVGSSGDPLRQGFDQFFGYNCQALAHNYYPDHLWRNDERVTYNNTNSNLETYSADLIHQQALQFMAANKSKPFFLFLSYTLPHAALQVPEDTVFDYYRDLFGESRSATQQLWNGKGYAPQSSPRAAYASMVTRLDRYVGDVISQLKTLGLDKNTLIIFTSDNGPHREGGNDPSFFNSSGGLRGIKRDLYEGGIRVPMIVSWPGRIKPGVSDHLAASWDFMPTFAEAGGITTPANSDGISLLPLLQNRAVKEHDYLYWEFHEQGGKQAVRKGKWKAVRLNVKDDPQAPIQLYDLNADQGETQDVASQFPDIIKEMKVIMEKAHVENADFPLK